MNRSDLARARWRKVAAKELDADTVDWLARVAAQVLEVDQQPAAERRRDMVRAVGLAGRRATGEQDLIRALMMVPFEDWGPAGTAPGQLADARRRAIAMMIGLDGWNADMIDQRIRRAQED